jgi:hypothetical protein
MLLTPAIARAQQYATDDAIVTPHRACQIQIWHGERSSWVQPLCSPVRNVELSLGFIAVWKDGTEDGRFEYAAQAKTQLKPLTKDGWGAAFVVGTGHDPALAQAGPVSSSVYAYLPLSVALAGDGVVLHQNTGWLLQRGGGDDASAQHALTWGARADVALHRGRHPLAAVAEVFGAEGAAGTAPEFQVGLRAFPRVETVQLDLTWGGYLRTGRRAAGWTLALTLITPPFL